MIAVQDIVTKYSPDAIAISKAGKHCKANDLKWINKSMTDYSNDNEHVYLNAIQTDFLTSYTRPIPQKNMNEGASSFSYITNGDTR
jgi:hypothetical protein